MEFPRFIYIGFENVSLEDLACANGGYADDIWFPFAGGAFHPNIQRVVIRRIVSQARVDPHRGTVTFSAPAQNITIQDARIYQLLAESRADWKLAPRKDEVFTPSRWNLDRIAAQGIAFAIQGKVVHLNASQLAASKFCQIELAGGKISDSTLTVLPGNPSRFFRLDGLHFESVKWLLKPDDKGVVGGLMLGAIGNDTCIASFHKNSFQVASAATFGQLINSVHSASSPGNSVTATFHQCEYPVEFVTAHSPATKVAVVQERGTWRFSTADFENRDPLLAIRKDDQADVILILEPYLAKQA